MCPPARTQRYRHRSPVLAAISLCLLYLVGLSAAQCPSGWTYYRDSSGIEGHDSCVVGYYWASVVWSVANTSCPVGTHMITFAAPSYNNNPLLSLTTSLTGWVYWVGCSQAWASIARNRGWSWVDGTPTTNNLDCGGLEATGCGLWRPWSYEPKCVLGPPPCSCASLCLCVCVRVCASVRVCLCSCVRARDADAVVVPTPTTTHERSDGGYWDEKDREDFCRMEYNVMNDMANWAGQSPYACEYDIVGSSYTMHKQFGSEVFLRGGYVELGIHSVGSFGTA